MVVVQEEEQGGRNSPPRAWSASRDTPSRHYSSAIEYLVHLNPEAYIISRLRHTPNTEDAHTTQSN